MGVTETFGPIATTDDTAVTCLAANADVAFDGLMIFNKGDADGYFSVDGGEDWRLLPAKSVRTYSGPINNAAVQAKRETGGDNLSEVYGEVNPGNFDLLEQRENRVLATASAEAAVSASGTETLVAAPGADKQIWVYGWTITGSADTRAQFKSASTTKYGNQYVAENGGNAKQAHHPDIPIFKCGTNEALTVTDGAGGDLAVGVTYDVADV